MFSGLKFQDVFEKLFFHIGGQIRFVRNFIAEFLELGAQFLDSLFLIWFVVKINHREVLRTQSVCSINSLKNDQLTAKVKGHHKVLEESIADTYLKVLLVMSGAGKPESCRRGIDGQSAKPH